MLEWAEQALSAPGFSFSVLLALLLFGVFSAVASACNIAMIGAITGYVGAGESDKRRDTVIAALSFAGGSILAMILVGAGIGYVGQVVGESFGRYSKLLAGLMLVFFGLVSLNLFPWRLPAFKPTGQGNHRGVLKTALFGFILGGSSVTCSISCYSPALLVALGVVGLQGQVVKGAVYMGVFGLGYSIPLAAVLLGASWGRWTLRATKAMPVIRVIAGILLLAVGFYFLATI